MSVHDKENPKIHTTDWNLYIERKINIYIEIKRTILLEDCKDSSKID